jgi:FkbM family methyltransferase
MKLTGLVKETMRKFGCDVAHYRPLRSDAFAVQKHLLAGHTCRRIFDVGGYHGEVAATYAEMFPQAEVYTFEPFPPSHEQLAARFRNNPRVHVVQGAVSSRTGESKFHVNVHPATNSLLATGQGSAVTSGAVTTEVISVPTLTLDEFCQSRGLEVPEILKFDIQGNELEALRGATHILEANGPLLIYLEVLFERLYKNCALFGDIAGFLQEKGYELYNLYELQHSPEGRLEYGDALFVSKRLLSA